MDDDSTAALSGYMRTSEFRPGRRQNLLDTLFGKSETGHKHAAEAGKEIKPVWLFPSWENEDNRLLCTFSCFPTHLVRSCEESDDGKKKKSINLGNAFAPNSGVNSRAKSQSPAFAPFLQLFTPL